MMKLRQYVNAVVLNVFSSMNALDAELLDDQRLIELKSEVCNMFLDSRAAASQQDALRERAKTFNRKNNTSIRAGGRTDERTNEGQRGSISHVLSTPDGQLRGARSIAHLARGDSSPGNRKPSASCLIVIPQRTCSAPE